LSGAQVWILACWSIVSRNSVSVVMWKMSRSRRFWILVSSVAGGLVGEHTVIMSVFEGGDGSTSGGRSERSRESGDLDPDDARERCGEGICACMFAMVQVRKCMLACRAVGVCWWCQWGAKRQVKAYIKVRLSTAMQCASFRNQRRRWGSASGLPSLELRRTKCDPVPCLAVLAHSGHLGICTACSSTPGRTVQ
jgi:hypothetical protein